MFSLLNPRVLLGWLSFSLSRFHMLSINGYLRDWRIGAQASPNHEALLSKLGVQLRGPSGMAWGLMTERHGFSSYGGITLSRC